jgi:2-dehydro-3-deoxyphosphogluconate aldolase/(4S)-4-hydroxy-2-oxoglutarate aldolase
MEPDQALNRIEDLGLLAVVRGESRGAAVEVSEALVEGGVLGIEITFTTPEAPQVIRDLNEEYADRVLPGAGTVTTHEQVEQAAEAGATFLVSPGCDPNLLPAMLGTGLLVLPGTLTPSEVMLACAAVICLLG